MSKAEGMAKPCSWNLTSDRGSRQAGRGLSGSYLPCQIEALEARLRSARWPHTLEDGHGLRHGGAHREDCSRKDPKATGHRVKNPSCVLQDKRPGPSSHWVVLHIQPQVGTPGLDRFLLLCVVHAKEHCPKPGSASVSREV